MKSKPKRVHEARLAYRPRTARTRRLKPDAPQIVSAQTKVPFRFDAEVREGGRIELSTPLPPGKRVTVFVLEDLDASFADLAVASETSLAFWDNPIDDAEWNNA